MNSTIHMWAQSLSKQAATAPNLVYEGDSVDKGLRSSLLKTIFSPSALIESDSRTEALADLENMSNHGYMAKNQAKPKTDEYVIQAPLAHSALGITASAAAVAGGSALLNLALGRENTWRKTGLAALLGGVVGHVLTAKERKEKADKLMSKYQNMQDVSQKLGPQAQIAGAVLGNPAYLSDVDRVAVLGPRHKSYMQALSNIAQPSPSTLQRPVQVVELPPDAPLAKTASTTYNSNNTYTTYMQLKQILTQ